MPETRIPPCPLADLCAEAERLALRGGGSEAEGPRVGGSGGEARGRRAVDEIGGVDARATSRSAPPTSGRARSGGRLFRASRPAPSEGGASRGRRPRPPQRSLGDRRYRRTGAATLLGRGGGLPGALDATLPKASPPSTCPRHRDPTAALAAHPARRGWGGRAYHGQRRLGARLRSAMKGPGVGWGGSHLPTPFSSAPNAKAEDEVQARLPHHAEADGQADPWQQPLHAVSSE